MMSERLANLKQAVMSMSYHKVVTTSQWYANMCALAGLSLAKGSPLHKAGTAGPRLPRLRQAEVSTSAPQY